MAVAALLRDLRSETRLIFAGEVQLQPEGSTVDVQARLLDVSNNGFRASHGSADLLPGQAVRFHHRFFMGRARVAWTHELAGQTHSGFQIIRN